MSENNSQQERLLRDQVRDSEHRLGDLEQKLQAASAQLQALTEQQPQYSALSQILGALEHLNALGATELFWGGNRIDSDDRRAQLEQASRRLDDFNDQVTCAQEQHHAIAAEIGSQNQNIEELHYQLLDAIAEEESRQREWLVERELDSLPVREQVMPWARGCEEDQRFRRSLAVSVASALVAALLVSLVDIPVLPRSAVIEVPERVARLVREERKLPPPPPPVEEAPLPQEEPPEPELAEVVEPEPEVRPNEPEQPVVAQAEQPAPREQVKSKGILAFRESFADRANLRPAAQLGSSARLSNAGETAVGRPERSMVTTNAPGSSGGINLADISRDVGGGGGEGLAGVQISKVASAIGGGDGMDRPLSGGGASAGRTDEEIQIVFDRYKAALYRLYNRELRKNPTLRGQLTLKLTIEPNGTVSLCKLQSSNMGAPALAQQVIDRVRGFDFGAKEGISEVTIVYPIDFLPAA